MSILCTQSISVSDNDTSNGHDALFFIPVRILAAKKLEPLTLDYEIRCRNLPTWWRLGVTYEHKPETGKVFCFVTLSRTDTSEGCLNVFVLVSYVNADNIFVRYPKVIGSAQVFAGGKIQGSAEESRHPGFRSYIFSLGLLLRISIFIRDCHSDPGLFHAKHDSIIDAKGTHHSKM